MTLGNREAGVEPGVVWGEWSKVGGFGVVFDPAGVDGGCLVRGSCEELVLVVGIGGEGEGSCAGPGSDRRKVALPPEVGTETKAGEVVEQGREERGSRARVATVFASECTPPGGDGDEATMEDEGEVRR